MRRPLGFQSDFRYTTYIRGKGLWPKLPTDVGAHIKIFTCWQRRKSSDRPLKLHVGHRPVPRAFQCFTVVLVEYEGLPEEIRFILSAIDNLRRYVIFVTVKKERFARQVMFWSNVCYWCLALQNRRIPPWGLKLKNLVNENAKELQSDDVLGVRNCVQPSFAIRVILPWSVFTTLSVTLWIMQHPAFITNGQSCVYLSNSRITARIVQRSRKTLSSSCPGLSISSAGFRPPPHGSHSSTILSKLSSNFYSHSSWPAVLSA